MYILGGWEGGCCKLPNEIKTLNDSTVKYPRLLVVAMQKKSSLLNLGTLHCTFLWST